MAVNLYPPEPSEIYPVPGVVLGVAEANIRKPNRKDVLVVELALGSRVAGVFTSNRFAAAPVQVCRKHLSETNNIRAIVVNTGIANAGTRPSGRDRCGRDLPKGLGYFELLADSSSAVLHRCDYGVAAYAQSA